MEIKDDISMLVEPMQNVDFGHVTEFPMNVVLAMMSLGNGNTK